MSILSTIKGWLSVFLRTKAKDEFNLDPISSPELEAWVNECINIYKGNPSWLDEDEHIDTVNMAKSVCSEIARLAFMGIGIHADGSARAGWLQEQIDKVYFKLREWIEYGCAYGTVILKPNGDTIDLYVPGQYEVTGISNGKIDGIVFYAEPEQIGKKWYNRLEYHRFENGQYVISNKCYIGDSENDFRERVDISLTPWAGMQEEAYLENVKQPLYGVFRTPHANNIDLNSPMGLPAFSEAVQELRDLDIAYSRNSKEVKDSKRIVLADDSLLTGSGQKVANSPIAARAMADRIGLPDMVKMVHGSGQDEYYQEINPTLNTATRLTGINALLNQIGFKCGFSNGHFVFNESTGIQTATQVEADQQRTIQLTKDVRDKLESCLDDLFYALNVFADLYDLAPVGEYEITYDFGDITYNRDEDRARWWNYVQAGKVPAWVFFVKFEGIPEDEAKAMVAEAQPSTPTLFA